MFSEVWCLDRSGLFALVLVVLGFFLGCTLGYHVGVYVQRRRLFGKRIGFARDVLS